MWLFYEQSQVVTNVCKLQFFATFKFVNKQEADAHERVL